MSDDITATDYSDTDCPAPVVGGLVTQLQCIANHVGNLGCGEAVAAAVTIREGAARISQLEAWLEAALPYVEATNRADHLMDGFGPRSRQSSDEHVAAIRALLKGQS